MTASISNVSIIVCAYTLKRWQELCDCLNACLAQQPAVGEVILVVDHNSELMSKSLAAFPGVRVIANRYPQGLSGARNSGIDAARGDLLLFIDDDACPEPACANHLAGAFSDPHVAGVSARVIPAWTGTQPRWFPDEFLWVVGCSHDAGSTAARVRNLIGAGMCIRRDVFLRAGGFDSGMGRTRSWLPMGCEETDFCMRAADAIPGAYFVCEPRAVVHHTVEPGRTHWPYFLKRCLAEGLSKAQLRAKFAGRSALNVERQYVLSTLARAVGRDGRAVLAGDVYGAARIAASILGVATAAIGFAAFSLRRPAMRSAPTAAGWPKQTAPQPSPYSKGSP